MAGTEIIYQLKFDDFNENEITINIKQAGYAGSTTTVLGGANPCIIRMLGEGDSKFSHIKATECVIEFISSTSLQYLSLFTSPSKTYYVEVYRVAQLLWTGWVNPEYYSEPFIPAPYPINIHATDGIADLKNIDYTAALTAGTFRQNVITIIANCLKQIAHVNTLNIYVSLGLSATTSADGVVTTRLLEKLFLDYRAFRENWTTWSCYDVLNEILSSLDARIYQYYGAWHIERIDQKRSTYDVEVYDDDGVYSSTTSAFNPVVDLTGYSAGDIIRFINTPAMLEVQPAYKGFRIEQEYGQRKNILPFSNFEGVFLEEDFTGVNTLRYWDHEQGAEEAILVKVASKNDPNKRILKMKGINYVTGQVPAFTAYIMPRETGSPASPYQWTYNEGAVGEGALMLWLSGVGSMRFEFKTYAAWSDYTTDAPGLRSYIRILLNCSGTVYVAWFDHNDLTNYEWVEEGSSGTLEASHIDIILPKDEWYTGEIRLTCPEAEVGNAQTYVGVNVLVSSPNVSAASLDIDDGILYEYVRCYFTDDSEEERVRFYDSVIDDDNILEPEEYKYKFGDVPLYYTSKLDLNDGGALISKYAYFDSGNETVNYFGNGSNHEMSLYSQILYTDLNITYRQPLFKLRGTIIDTAIGDGTPPEGHLDFRTTIKDYDSRYYTPTGLAYNLKTSTFEGEWLQIYDDSGTTGEFNNDFNEDFWI